MSSSAFNQKQLLFFTNYHPHEGRHMNKYSINFLLLLTLGSTLFAQDLTQPLNSSPDKPIEELELPADQQPNSSDLFTTQNNTTIENETETSVFKPSYTLGRFTDGGILNATGSIDRHDGDTYINFDPRFYTGKEHTYGVYINGFIYLRSYDYGDVQVSRFSLGLGSVSGQYLITPGHVLYALINPTNVWSSTTSYPDSTVSKLGTENPAVTYNTYGSKLLTNDGEIDISTPGYQLAFLFGPMLNKMQYKHNVTIQHQWWDSFDLETLSYSGDFGILNNLSFGTTLELNRSKENILVNNGNIQQYEEKNYYSKATSLRLQGRTDKLFGMLSYGGSDKSGAKTDFLPTLNKTGSLLTLSGGYLHGSRALTFANVNGNWDSYYDQTLGRGQILGTADFYIAPYMDDGKSAYDINAKLDGAYGISDEINAGAIFYRNGGKYDADAENTFIIKASYCTVPLRDYGPGMAPILEYHYGKKPGPGEFKADAWFKLPVADNHTAITYDQTAPQQELFKATAAAGLAGDLYGEGTFSYDNNEDGDSKNITIDLTAGMQAESSHFYISWSLEILEENNEFGALSGGARILF